MIKVFKTYEISDDLWQQIADGFNESFEGHHATVESLKNGFCVRNQWGYAYHAIAFDNETHEVSGFNTYTPTLYENGLKLFVSGSTFVKKKYRKDVFIFYNMVKALRTRGIEDGFMVNVGVPNKNSVNYALKFLGVNLVGYLDYYILPRNISNCTKKPVLKPFNVLSRFWTNMHISIQGFMVLLSNSSERHVKYSLKVDNPFYEVRFGNPCYHKFEKGNITAFYRMINEDGIETAYLLDFREKDQRTNRSLVKAVRYIVHKEKPDAILFVGFLRMKQHVLIKVPKRFVPKPLPFVYTIFDKSKKEEFSDMADINNWNFSLMNFDVR